MSLSNTITRDLPHVEFPGLSLAGEEDVAWDAVGFEVLDDKPDEFVVALGDSFASGEGAGDYFPWSDNNGEDAEARNSCHQSANAWIRKTFLPGYAYPLGVFADAPEDSDVDFHFLACSGAESEQLLPYYTTSSPRPRNGDDELGEGQWSTVSQLDAGYLDHNTTLVTLSIGGNDMRFVPILSGCVTAWLTVVDGDCSGMILPGDTLDVETESYDRAVNELQDSVLAVLEEIRAAAPNAQIALMGYPELFETDGECVLIADTNLTWLNNLTDSLNGTLAFAAAQADLAPGPDIFFVDPRPYFSGHNLCSGTSAINGLDFVPRPGENALFIFGNLGFMTDGGYVSQVSVHPNDYGTDLFAEALEDALALHP